MFTPALLKNSRHVVLADAAFGNRPGLGAAELPAAADTLGSWYRAVILGGQGRYAAARAELRRVCAGDTDPVLLSLAASTEGSLLRQLGWHAAAATLDGRAVALTVPVGPGRANYVGALDRTDAICDALTGLAADALGTGRLSLADRLLRRGQATVEEGQTGWRPPIRWHWVAAETALAAGRAAAAMVHAEAALALAERAPSVRHVIKSRLLVAAAAAAADDHERSRALAEVVADQCREHGLLPLRWASAMLRAGLSVTGAAAESVECAALITHRGGRFRATGAY